MAIFQYGEWIKTKREELGLSQEELADGICSVPTLSRIENGRRAPSAEHFQRILERLGYSSTIADSFANQLNFQLHELKYQLRQAYINRDVERAKELLRKYESICPPSSLNKQFILLYNTIFNGSELSTEETLERLEQALRITCPKYSEQRLPKLLSYEEIILVNGIANCFWRLGRPKDAIRLYYHLKQFYDRQMVNAEEVLRTQPMVLYNLSKVLGLEGRYDECVEICDLGIRICKTSGRALRLAHMLYNKAWALEKRNQGTDLETARQCAVDAYQMARLLGQEKEKTFFGKFIKDTFPEVCHCINQSMSNSQQG